MDKLHSIIAELGGDPVRMGYEMTCDCIQALIEDPFMARSITKNLYVIVGDKHDVAPSCVDRDIRTMLHQMQDQEAFFERLKKVGIKYHAPCLLQQYGQGDPIKPKQFLLTMASVLGDTWKEEAEE